MWQGVAQRKRRRKLRAPRAGEQPKSMVATYFEVDLRTVERYVSENVKEISENGYEDLKGNRLKDFLACVSEQDVPDINVRNISNRTP